MYPQSNNPYYKNQFLNTNNTSTGTLPGLPTYWKNIKNFFTKKPENPKNG